MNHGDQARRHRAGGIIVVLILLLSAAWATGAAVAKGSPPPPQPAGITGTAPGTIYYGAVPPGANSKPVLVFVHGMHGKAEHWWTETGYYGRNDMYDYAYNYGYRTAFVDLLDSTGAGASMWANGQLLRGQLDTIATHYGVQSLNVVGHSKGGIDTQAAIVHYGAGPRVEKLFTLSTPHWGAQLADLCYSSWTWWLAALLGQRDDGTYSVQTGYMSWFRSITDNRPENELTHYYTGAGSSWGPWFSALWFGGSYLSFSGQNDGLVTAPNAHNPRATHVFTRNLDHDSVRMGRTVFPLMDPYLHSLWRGGSQPEAPVPDPTNPQAHTTAGSILRGGPIDPATGAADSILVERGATHLTLDLVSNGAGLSIVWTAPDGTTYQPKPVGDTTGYFRGGTHYIVDVDAPAAGTWRFQARNPAARSAAYLLMADLASSLTVTLDRDSALTFVPGSALLLSVQATDAQGRAVTHLQVSGDLALDGGKAQPIPPQTGGATARPVLTLPNATGVANLSLTIRGQLSDGSPFERSLATSLAVVAPGASLPVR
jgi:hypothetical protein